MWTNRKLISYLLIALYLACFDSVIVLTIAIYGDMIGPQFVQMRRKYQITRRSWNLACDQPWLHLSRNISKSRARFHPAQI